MRKPSAPTLRDAQRHPMIDEQEVLTLSRWYGAPARRTYNVLADDYIRGYRWRTDSDRRAEVVFAIQDPQGRLWLHAKDHYPAHILRLPSGGINWEESVLDALLREIDEETGLEVEIERFVGLITYRFLDGDATAHFASYVFHVRCGHGRPTSHSTENISAFRALLPSQLAQMAADMRNLYSDRRGWGQWRALAHDLVYEHLTR